MLATAALLAPVAACSPAAEVPPAAACAPAAALAVTLYGGVEATLDWDGDDMACEGMPRPDGAGARLRFAGPARIDDVERPLALIVALPELEPGRASDELPANVTLIEEDAGRFFSTRDTDVCWADVEFQRPLAGGAAPSQYEIGGLLYCVAPLAELNGNGSVMLGELRFAGRVDWRLPK